MTRRADLEAVRRTGKRIRSRYVELRARASPSARSATDVDTRACPRVGIIVPRHKHSAVERNRLKRRLREVIRLHLLAHLPAVDVVIRALPEAYTATYAELVDQLVRLAPHCGRPRPAAGER